MSNNASKSRVYLRCSHKDRDEIKSLGAKYERNPVSKWYIPAGLSETPFKKWIIDEQEEKERKEALQQLISENGSWRPRFLQQLLEKEQEQNDEAQLQNQAAHLNSPNESAPEALDTSEAKRMRIEGVTDSDSLTL